MKKFKKRKKNEKNEKEDPEKDKFFFWINLTKKLKKRQFPLFAFLPNEKC